MGVIVICAFIALLLSPFLFLLYGCIGGYTFYRRYRAHNALKPFTAEDAKNAFQSLPMELSTGYFETRDGIRLHYQSIGTGSKVVLLANGLGGRYHLWEPVISYFVKHYDYENYRMIT